MSRDAPNSDIRVRVDSDSTRFGFELDGFGFKRIRFLSGLGSRESDPTRIRICDKIRFLSTVTERSFGINCPLNYIACTQTEVK